MDKITKKHLEQKIRNIVKMLRMSLCPTPSEQQRAWHQEDERRTRYEKYIPHFMPKTYATIFSWFPLCMFIFFMTFGISVIERSEKITEEAAQEYKKVFQETNNKNIATMAAQEYMEQHPVTHDTQMLNAWNCIMQPLHLDKNTTLNWLILLQGTIIGLTPTLVLAHRKRVVDKMHAEKWKLISPLDKTDRKIIHDMSRDAPNYFYHLTLSLTGPEKLKKYKKIAIPIVQGYAKSHPEDNKRTMAILKVFDKTK